MKNIAAIENQENQRTYSQNDTDFNKNEHDQFNE